MLSRLSTPLFFLLLLCRLSAEESCSELKNGLKYLIIEDRESPAITLDWIVEIDPEAKELGKEKRFLLLAHALFCGTRSFSSAAIRELLHETGQDIDPWRHIEASRYPLIIRFRTERLKELERLLPLIAEMGQSAELSPACIELARERLLAGCKELSSCIALLTHDRLKSCYKRFFRPDLMQLVVSGDLDQGRVEKLLERHFSDWTRPDEAPPRQPFKRSREALREEAADPVETKALVCSRKGNEYLIDGKIHMKNPSWYQKRRQGRWFGIGCLALGLGSVFLSIVSANPLIAVAGLAPLAAGGWFLVDPYLLDPVVIYEKRKEDLRFGLCHAYSHRRAGLTLTPLERRRSFLEECSRQGLPVKDSPIAHLADLYDLNDPLLREAFHREELGNLYDLSRQFILARNESKKAGQLLEEELNRLLLPHQMIRDAAVEQALLRYESNCYVIEFNRLERERELEIDQLIEHYERGLIDRCTCDTLIAELEEEYDLLFRRPSLQNGLEEAELELRFAEESASLIYMAKKQELKAFIHYEERLARIDQGLLALYSYYNGLLFDYAGRLPEDADSFADSIDLR